MAEPEERFAERALDRIWKAMFAIGAGGAILAYAWNGWTWCSGFLLGAAAAVINFRWMKQIVDALGSVRPTGWRVAILAGLRYLLLGGGAYVILEYSSISIAGALLGLFVPVAAVIVEIIIELTYARI
jgi:ATP synthase I subunit